MKVLLYNPDNGVSRNFMPHLWMFLLHALTPSGHEVVLVDGNTHPMCDAELVRYARQCGVGLVGIGSMTRMIARAYRIADALRAAGIPVVMGGPHVTALPDEALGRSGGPRHANAVALGEADATWPDIVRDAELGRLKEVYASPRRPTLKDYPRIRWDTLDLDQFNRIPLFFRRIFAHCNIGWETFHIIPVESGRGCPYGCEFCTVTGFFGDSLRYRTNESVVEELLRIKDRARRTNGKIAVFFVDDNFAIDVKRTKILLRDIIAASAQTAWVGQISANLLKDEELVDLIAESGGKWIFIGMESVDPENLKRLNKSFNKPSEYGEVLERLARRNVYAITSFIFGLDNDTAGVADRTLAELDQWPPVLPVFGQITPYPSTPLYERLKKAGRLTRPTHWLDFAAFRMAHMPERMGIEQVEAEVQGAWLRSYRPSATSKALRLLKDDPAPFRISHLIARLFFRGIYFPPNGTLGWVSLIARNSGAIASVVWSCLWNWRGSGIRRKSLSFDAGSLPETGRGLRLTH